MKAITSTLYFNTWTSRSNSAFVRKSLSMHDIILAILSFVSLPVYSRLSKLGRFIGNVVKFPILMDLYMGTDVSGLCVATGSTFLATGLYLAPMTDLVNCLEMSWACFLS